ncbi:MAG: hypothetical protein ACOYD6_02350 [Limnochordia bacterium]|jgi:UDP-GlcNAc:undecaprenyl-phosphate GlcNAc-1-phosphate transferase
MVLLIMAAGALATFLALEGILELSQEAGFVRENYRGERIPFCGGLAVILGSFFGGIVGLFFGFYDESQLSLLSITLFGFGLLGLLDDVGGDHSAKGLRGHARALMEGRLTTGALKALYGGLLSLTLAYLLGGGLILNGLIIALTTNGLNLMDLRPGRCGKVFVLGLLVVLLVARDSRLEIFVPVAAAMMVYLPWDLGAKVMLGDMGSNPLGALLGVGFVIAGGGLWLLVGLVVVHWYAEKYSISRLVEGSRLLRFLDKLGQS